MVYQSTYGLRASGTLWFGISSVGLTLKNEVIDQMSQPYVNKIEFYSGSKMIYSTETLDGSDFSLGHANNQGSTLEGHGITISGAYLLTSHLNDNNAVKSVYGNIQNTDHWSFDTVKTYGTSGLIETRDYSFNLTTNLVELPNGTAGFVGNYTGAYTRNITDSFVGNYSRNFAGEYAGNYARGFTGEYTGTFSRDFGGEYTGTYSRDFVGEYVGNYSRDFAGEYTGTFTGPDGVSYGVFDGTNNSYLQIPAQHIGGDSFTLEAFVNPSAYNVAEGRGTILSYKQPQVANHFNISVLNEGRFGLNAKNDSGTLFSRVTNVGDIPLNQWSHVVIQGKDMGSNRLISGYVNGSLKFSFFMNNNLFGQGPGQYFELGARRAAAGGFDQRFTGKISDVRLVKNVLVYDDESTYIVPTQPLTSTSTIPGFTGSNTAANGDLKLHDLTGSSWSNASASGSGFSYVGTVGFVGNYIGEYTRNVTDAYTGAYTRNFTGDYTGAYSRGFTGEYTGTFSRDFTGDFVNNFSRDFVGQYTGNYSRAFAGEYTGTFVGPVFPIVELVNEGDFENNPSLDGQFPAGWINLNFPSTEPKITTAYNNGEKRLRIQYWTTTPLVNNQRVMKQNISGLTPGREYELKIFAYDTSTVSDGAGGNIQNPPALELVHGSTSEFVGQALTPKNHNYPPYNSDSVTFIASATTATLYVLRAASIISDISLKATQVLTGFAGNYVGNYSRDFVGEYTGNFTRAFAGEYTGNYSRSFSGQYTGTFSSYFTGNYTGNYSRTFAGEYTGTYSGPQQTAYQSEVGVRNGFSNSAGFYFGTSANAMYTRNAVKNAIDAGGGSTSKIEFYFGPNMFFSVESPENVYGGSLQPQNYYFNNEMSGYGITFSASNNLIKTYDASLTASSEESYGGYYKSFDTIKTYDVNGNLLQSVELTSNLTSNLVNVPGAVGYVGNYSRVRVSAYSRLRTSAYTGTYSRDRVSTYAGDFIGDYARNFAGNYTRSFEGNYARSFLGNYVGATISDSLTNVTETYTLYVRVA